MAVATIIAGVAALASAIPAIKQLFESGIDPNSDEFKAKYEAIRSQYPQYESAFRQAEKETFGALKSAQAVGGQQAELAAALKAQAEGKGPSLAAMQYARALEQSQAAAASQLASARGLSPAAAQRMLMAQQAAARQAAAGRSAELRLQEQQAAQGMLGNLLGQQRQQELLGGQLAAGMYGTAGQMGMEQARLEQAAKMGALGIEQQERAQERQSAGTAAQAGVALAMPFIAEEAKRQPAAATTASKGGEIKGRAMHKGDTRSNDTVPALLSPGEIVLPRSVAQDEEAPEKAKKFVEAIKSKKKPTPRDYIAALSRLSELESRLNAIETLMDFEAEEEG
jgi:hypothetical protein